MTIRIEGGSATSTEKIAIMESVDKGIAKCLQLKSTTAVMGSTGVREALLHLLDGEMVPKRIQQLAESEETLLEERTSCLFVSGSGKSSLVRIGFWLLDVPYFWTVRADCHQERLLSSVTRILTVVREAEDCPSCLRILPVLEDGWKA
jgi:hypothetical protein